VTPASRTVAPADDVDDDDVIIIDDEDEDDEELIMGGDSDSDSDEEEVELIRHADDDPEVFAFKPTKPVSFRVGERFSFNAPSRLTGGFEVTLFESAKHPYTSLNWSESHFAMGSVMFSELNDGEGLQRGGREANDDVELILRSPDGEDVGSAIVRVIELLRFQVCILDGSNMPTDKELAVVVEFGSSQLRTRPCPVKPRADGTSGTKGNPKWNEQFTYFAPKYDFVKFHVVDEDRDRIGKCGKFDLSRLERGIPKEVELRVDKASGATIRVRLIDEGTPNVAQRKLDRARRRATLMTHDMAKRLAELSVRLQEQARASRASFRRKSIA
jgi:hypothetical protein